MIEGPYKLPEGWRWVRLGEVLFSIESGRRPRGGVKWVERGIPSIGAEHIDERGKFDWRKIKFVSEEFYKGMHKGLINIGDILLVKDGSTIGRVAYVDSSFPFNTACVNEHVFTLKVKQETVFSKYLFYFLRGPLAQSQIRNFVRGAAQGGLSRSFVQELLVPIPPLEYQYLLVQKLDKLLELLDEAKDARRSAALLSNILLQSMIDHAFSKVEPTGLCADIITFNPRSGPSFRTSPDGRGIPVLMPSSVSGFGVDLSKVEYGRGDEKIDPKDLLEPGDIIIARGNKPEQVGNAGVVPEDARGWVCANLLMKLRVDLERTEPHFFVWWFRTSYMRDVIKRSLSGTNPSIQKINQKKILGFPFPVQISLAEQRRIVAYLDQVQAWVTALKKAQEATETELRRLEQAILDKAFRGGLSL